MPRKLGITPSQPAAGKKEEDSNKKFLTPVTFSLFLYREALLTQLLTNTQANKKKKRGIHENKLKH